MKPDAPESIRLRGVRQNNLKGIDVDIPLGQLTVVTGLSGTGKSSLVFETLHAEGHRRYVETFSPYARQFMDLLRRPDVDRIENIRPSIAIEQRNTVRTSRSTVGTMTEICDYAKVWFAQVAQLIDPADGAVIEDDHPDSIFAKACEAFSGKTVVLCFPITCPASLSWDAVLGPLRKQGYQRVFTGGERHALEALDPEQLRPEDTLQVVQDRLKLEPAQRDRFLDAARTALEFGRGELTLLDSRGRLLQRYSTDLRSPVTGQRFRPATPNLFSFNSPLGACPECRGFGRVIRIDPRLVIPDISKSIGQRCVQAFTGDVYSHSQQDLLKACRSFGIPTDIPYRELSEEHQALVWDGDPEYQDNGDKDWPTTWYGIHRFFRWLESNTYKMHVRVFLARYRSYVTCPSCGGARLQPESLCWRWRGHTLPELYQLPVRELERELEQHAETLEERGAELAREAMLTRLRYLDQVGLGYLTLDRTSRTLSGGETQRVNLTSCLGTALVDTLFVLDEPSIGLHARDLDRLTGILRRLVDQGNTVVVVEHDEAVMRAADQLVEMGPKPGSAGGALVYAGEPEGLLQQPDSITGAYLSGREQPAAMQPRPVEGERDQPWLRASGATCHNLRALDVAVPLQRLVVLSGVSGSGKSTLLESVLYAGLLQQAGKAVETPAEIASLESDRGFSEIVQVDQSPVTKTPRSNPALYVEAWDHVRQLFARTPEARAMGLTASAFSFNSGTGRCPQCDGLGYERIEMQFMADLYVPCGVCDGKRFKEEILRLTWQGHSVADVLELTVQEALEVFAGEARILHRLQPLEAVGLGYLQLGQPLNTLSGGEAQRLKLVRFLGQLGDRSDHALLLLDEPTTGLHRHDVQRLIEVLQRLVDRGHSLVVIEHHIDVIQAADWVLEMGPGAGAEGGRILFAGTPAALAKTDAPTANFLHPPHPGRAQTRAEAAPLPFPTAQPRGQLKAAAPQITLAEDEAPEAALEVIGAREHNLRDLHLKIPQRAMTVVTGVSGSGKSTLAFDIVFAEGQRRFMESMSAWARQYVEQLPRPEVDQLKGIAPTVAVEQRIHRGTRKSTVATITEVAQYLRLLYARIGVPHSPHTGKALAAASVDAVVRQLRQSAKRLFEEGAELLYLGAPVVRARKGHHQPLADWALQQGYALLRADGELVPLGSFERLDRYREHDLELVIADLVQDKRGRIRCAVREREVSLADALEEALRIGSKVAFLARADGAPVRWFSTTRADPVTGEAFPQLDPKHFSWNSSQGWCPMCRGHGKLYSWMSDQESFDGLPETFEDGQDCPACQGTRLNARARAVYLQQKDGPPINLPALLAQPPARMLATLEHLDLPPRDAAVLREVLPEIRERLAFLDQVGLNYLSLDRATATLSGGEAQRIRLAAHLGSNLSGVLYVLDEPSIGLHVRDQHRLLEALERLKAQGNTLLIVEHDTETMRRADHIIDLGPGAGRHGGTVLAEGPLPKLLATEASLTGRYLRKGIPHPLRGNYRPLTTPPAARARKPAEDWIVLEQPRRHNLRMDRVCIPTGRLSVVCGPSGAGKSTLLREVLLPATRAACERGEARYTDTAGTGQQRFKRLLGGHAFRHVIEVEQSPIGKTPRSTPATYLGVFDAIRRCFAALPEAKMRGLTASSFSFNTAGGRCEACKGAGRVKLEMSFMPDAYVPCDSCGGRRYSEALLGLHWKGKSIADVLEMTFEEATAFFHFDAQLRDILALMVETGLGYLELGQSSPTLSGGEAQRLKLVAELAKGIRSPRAREQGGNNLYLLEEPTIGLHLSDVERLLHLLHRLVEQGHTVVVIEHHLDVIAEADYVLELGPSGGDAGGDLLYQGPVLPLLDRASSPTGPYLREVFDRTVAAVQASA